MSVLSLPRNPSWRFELLDRHDHVIRDLSGVVLGGGCEIVARSRLGLSGTLDLLDDGVVPDWRNHRVRVVHDIGVAGVEPWAVGTFTFASPQEKSDESGRVFSVGLSSKLALLDASKVGSTFALPEGANIVDAVVALIQGAGESRIAATASSASLRHGRVWEPGEPRLTIINELLELAGYWSLWTDGAGQYRVEPYVEPSRRPVVHEFVRGLPGGVHSPVWERYRDEASIPNVVIVRSPGDGESEVISAVAVNDDPADPFSTVNSPENALFEEVHDLESVAAAQALADRMLIDRRSSVGRLSASHVPVPVVVNDLIRFVDAGYSGLATVQRLEYEFSEGAWCRAEWREVD